MNKLLQYECLNYVQIGAQVISSDMEYLYLNPFLLNELNMRADEIIGYSMSEKFPGVEKIDVYKKIQHCLKTGEKQQFTNEFVYKNKGRVFYDVLVQKVPEGVLIFTTDISESIRGEQLLQQSNELLEKKVRFKTLELEQKAEIEKEKTQRLKLLQERLSVLLENLPGAYVQYIVTKDGIEKVEFISAGVIDICEFKPSQINNNVQILWDLVKEEDMPGLVDSIRKSSEQQKMWEHEWRIVTPSGKLKWLRGIGRPKSDGCGNVMWNSIFMDITTTKEHENLRHRLDQLLDNVPGVFIQYSVDLLGNARMEYVTPGSVDIWGLTSEEIGTNPAPLWDMIHEDDIDGMNATIEQSRNSLEKWEYEWRIRKPSGDIHWLKGQSTPRRLSSGTVVFNTSVMDITESKQQQASLAIVQRLDAIGQLAAGISHDFNNILGIIDGNRELLEYKTEDPNLLKHINKIANATERAQNLTKRLLRSSRRKQDTNKPKTLLTDSIKDAKALLHEVTPANIKVDWKIKQHNKVSVDNEEFQDVFTNLYINALNAITADGLLLIETKSRSKFKPPGNAYIYSTPVVAEKYTVLSLTDNGCGIPLDKIEKAFLPFVSLSEKAHGTGLGLSMVGGFVSRNSYGLTVETKVNVGTKISVWFPVHENVSPSKPKDDKKTLHESKKLNVVLIDDEKDALDALSEMLTINGYAVTKFFDSARGMTWIQQNIKFVDLIISDSTMPGPIQGKNIYDAFSKHIPVIVISGMFDEAELATNYTHMLKKPVYINALLEKISSLALAPNV